MTSFPEIGRLYRRVRKEAESHGKEATPYQYWKALAKLRKRCHSKVAKDPKGLRPETERPAQLEGYLERMRYAKESNMGEGAVPPDHYRQRGGYPD